MCTQQNLYFAHTMYVKGRVVPVLIKHYSLKAYGEVYA
jgi:hypothetical protein